MKNILDQIKEETPRAFKYFGIFYNSEFPEKLKVIDFDELSFEYQLGVFIAFFNSINSDLQFYATDFEVLRESVLEAFQTYEEYLFLDS